MNVTWPWFIAAIFFGAFAFAWLALDNRWGNGRTDQLDDDLSRHRAAVNDRLERVEDWIRLLDHRARDLPAVNTQEPAEVDTAEFEVAPATVPDGMPLAVQSALIERPHKSDDAPMVERTVNIGGTVQTFRIRAPREDVA